MSVVSFGSDFLWHYVRMTVLPAQIAVGLLVIDEVLAV